MNQKGRIERLQEIREKLEKQKLTTREERRKQYESGRMETGRHWNYYGHELDRTRYVRLIMLDRYMDDLGPGHAVFFEAGVYIDITTGQPYLVTEIDTVRPAGTTLCEHWEFNYGTPREISYEEMISLAEEVYPGIEEKYQGINHTNWQEYKDIEERYIDDIYQSLYQSNLDNSVDNDTIVRGGFDELSEQNCQETNLPDEPVNKVRQRSVTKEGSSENSEKKNMQNVKAGETQRRDKMHNAKAEDKRYRDKNVGYSSANEVSLVLNETANCVQTISLHSVSAGKKIKKNSPTLKFLFSLLSLAGCIALLLLCLYCFLSFALSTLQSSADSSTRKYTSLPVDSFESFLLGKSNAIDDAALYEVRGYRKMQIAIDLNDNNHIAFFKVVEHAEHPAFGGKLIASGFDSLIGQHISSAQIDAVAGVTLTSDAINEALKAAAISIER